MEFQRRREEAPYQNPRNIPSLDPKLAIATSFIKTTKHNNTSIYLATKIDKFILIDFKIFYSYCGTGKEFSK